MAASTINPPSKVVAVRDNDDVLRGLSRVLQQFGKDGGTNAQNVTRRAKNCNACNAEFVTDLTVCEFGVPSHHQSCRECTLVMLEPSAKIRKQKTRFRCPACETEGLSCDAVHACVEGKDRRLTIKMDLGKAGLIVTCREIKAAKRPDTEETSQADKASPPEKRRRNGKRT